jgi:hypothetical protein
VYQSTTATRTIPFPGDIEVQPTRQPFVCKKARWIAAAVLVLIATIVTAVVGGKVVMGMAKKAVIPPVYSTASAEVETVYVTTIVSSTSIVHIFVTPDPSIITATSTKPLAGPTPCTMSTPSPTLTPEPEAQKEQPPNINSPKPDSMTDTHAPENGGCITIGN